VADVGYVFLIIATFALLGLLAKAVERL